MSTLDGTRPDHPRAEPRDTRAPTPARAEAAVAGRGGRASRRNPSAVAAGAVRRHLDADDELQAADARGRAGQGRRREGDRDAADVAPGHAAGLRALSRGDERDELSLGVVD